jgi:hypothetical protein
VQISASEDKLMMTCMTLGSMDRSSRSFWFLEGRICSKVLMALSYVCCCQGDPPLECICQGIPPLESHIALSLAATAGKVIKCKGVFLHSNLPILILSPLLSLYLFDSHWHSSSSKSPYFDKHYFIMRSMMSWGHVFKWNFYCWFQLVWALKKIAWTSRAWSTEIASSSTQLVKIGNPNYTSVHCFGMKSIGECPRSGVDWSVPKVTRRLPNDKICW